MRYEDNDVVLRSRGDVVATPGGRGDARPDDSAAPERAARAHGGTAHQQGLGSTEAILTDPDGARFFVAARREL
ncbi:hypothetical protein ABT150_13605 [Streptomyces mirabilis]|uniref:hypothetical protein n=1 Tax=Streptomyces mirabilis TaxID=68239 RepID=UPI00331ECFEF